MSDRDNPGDIAFDMEDDLTQIDATIRAFITLTGKYDEGDYTGALPYSVCIVLSGKLLDDFESLRQKWRRLFEITHPHSPDNVERMVPR